MEVKVAIFRPKRYGSTFLRTFSHLIVTAAVGSRVGLGRSSLLAFAIGSALPDVPLLVLTGVTMATKPSWAEGMAQMHLAYESNLVWIGLHNAPHSLVVLGGVTLLIALLEKLPLKQVLLWALAGAALHALSDIFTHAGDGPMFLYPLSSLRFQSPVSYWDPKYYGHIFSIFEYLLDVVLALYLSYSYVMRKR